MNGQPKGIDWSTQPLGQVPDGVIATRLGVSRPTVRRARARRGILAHTRPGGTRALDMVLAAPFALAKEWGAGTWINSSRWVRPRLVRLVWGPRVHMSEYRSDGRLHGIAPVKSFPEDVHRVDAPEGVR